MPLNLRQRRVDWQDALLVFQRKKLGPDSETGAPEYRCEAQGASPGAATIRRSLSNHQEGETERRFHRVPRGGCRIAGVALA